MDERWLPVVGWESFYEVSDHGRVRRIAPRKDWAGGTRIHPETKRPVGVPPMRVLKPMLKNERPTVCLTRGEGTEWWPSVHVLVATAFLEPKPSPKHTVNHINGDKADNRVENLEWATAREQQTHAASLGLKRHTQYQRLTDDQAREVYATIGQVSGRQWALRLGVNQVIISSIRTGATYRWATGAPPHRRRGQWFPCTEECECRCHQRRK
jgi:hypothetical protein